MICACGEEHYSSVHRTEGPTYVYRFYDSADRLLYVGATSDLGLRIRAHAKDKPWWPEVARIEAMPFDLRCEAFRHEQVELTERAPVYARAQNSSPASKALVIRRRIEAVVAEREGRETRKRHLARQLERIAARSAS